MASENTNADATVSEPDAASEKIGPLPVAEVSAPAVHTSMSAIGRVNAGSFAATGSAIGAASVDGDATITASFAPAVLMRGNATVQQSYTSAVIVGGAETSVHQSVAPLIIGKTMDVSQSTGVVLVTNEASVKHSWVGILLSPKTTVSEDSRVLFSTTAALIIAGALLGGLGLVALALAFGARRAAQVRPRFTLPAIPAMPDMASLQQHLTTLQQRLQHLHRNA